MSAGGNVGTDPLISYIVGVVVVIIFIALLIG